MGTYSAFCGVRRGEASEVRISGPNPTGVCHPDEKSLLVASFLSGRMVVSLENRLGSAWEFSKMGKIRLASFRTQRALFDATGFVIKTDENKSARDAEHVELVLKDNSFPILPRKTKEKDLPAIPPTEVRRRNGEGDSGRLCTYLPPSVRVLHVLVSDQFAGIVVDSVVLDVTEYQTKHPAGRSILMGFGGQDCSWQWWSFHNRGIWQDVAVDLRVGRTEGVQNAHRRPRTIVGLRKHGFDDWD